MSTRGRRAAGFAGGALAALLLAVVVWPSPAADETPVPAPTTPTTPTTDAAPAVTTTSGPLPEVPMTTALATPQGEIATFDAPDGDAVGTVGYWYGYPMTMPVLEEAGEWLRVMLPERPNGSSAWVRRDEVATSSSRYRIVIRLGERRLTVYEDGFELFSAPAGIGTDETPTPTGSFFVAVISKPGPPGYGPIVLDTNGHSEAIESWQGTGDAITAIHGPISEASAAAIGTTGTANSNGCIRLRDEDQRKLDPVTLGTPVDIVA